MKTIILVTVLVTSLLLWSPPVQAQGMEENSSLYKELSETGRMTTGKVTEVYGVPCVELELKNGETIKNFIASVPSLKKHAISIEDRIALINKTHYLLNMGGPESDNMSTVKNKIFVPLNYTIKPQILPEYLSRAAKYDKFILIDRGLQYMGLYEKGRLTHCFPVSTGTDTPLRKFTIQFMDEFHNSRLFDNAQMDLALNIGGNYFIHEGIVPGYAASHGCVRVFPLDARFLFYKWAKPGIPGEIINSADKRQKEQDTSTASESQQSSGQKLAEPTSQAADEWPFLDGPQTVPKNQPPMFPWNIQNREIR